MGCDLMVFENSKAPNNVEELAKKHDVGFFDVSGEGEIFFRWRCDYKQVAI